MLGDIRHKWSLRRRPVQAAPTTPTERPKARTRPEREPQPPEWETEAWMRRVEAEARHRLKRDVRDIRGRRH
jgi:hypothetical protein